MVTHYVAHNARLDDGALLEAAGRLGAMPGILINGRFDFQAPIENAWTLKHAWPRAELVMIDDAGHLADEKIDAEIVRATDRLARRR